MSQRSKADAGSRGLFRLSRIVVAATMTTVVALSSLASAHAAPAQGWLRFGHFANGTGAVDIYVDGALASKNVGFEQVTPYASVAAAAHAVTILPAGSAATAAPLMTTSASVVAGSAATVAAFTDQTGLSTHVYVDDLTAPPSGQAKLRIIPTLSGQPSVNVYAAPSPTPNQPPTVNAANVGLSLGGAGKPALFSGVAFALATPYANVPSGVYDVEVRAATSDQLLLTGQNWPVLAGTVATLVVLTGPSGPTLEVLRDAAGAASRTTGGLATGAGGTAPRSARTRGFAEVAVLGSMALLAAAVLRRRIRLSGRA